MLKNEENAEAGDDKKAEDGNSARGAHAGEAGKLFGNTGNNGAIAVDAKKSAVDATKVVGAVSDANIFKAMIKDNGDACKLANTNPAVAVAGFTSPKDATIAGTIALRAMSKDGKFANSNAADDIATSVKGAAVSAVTKA